MAKLRDPSGPRYEDAYNLFRSAYSDSESPKILGNLGLCAMKLERDGEAIDALSRYLAEVDDIHPEERAQYETDLTTLRTSVAILVLVVSPSGALLSDERTATSGTVLNSYGPLEANSTLRVRAGYHRLTLQSQGYEPQSITLHLQPGSSERRVISLSPVLEVPTTVSVPKPAPDPVEESQAGSPIGFFIGLGVTGFLGTTTAILGGVAAGHHSQYEAALIAGDAALVDELKGEGQSFNDAADVLLAFTAAAAITTLVLLLTGDEASTSSALRDGALIAF